MTDPVRLLDDVEELSDDERRLLAAGRAMAPPEALSASLWSGLASRLPPANASGTPSTGAGGGLGAAGAAPQGSGLGLLFVKAALVAGTFGALVVGGRAWSRAHAAQSVAQTAAPKPAAPAPTEVPAPPLQEPSVGPVPADAEPAQPSPAPRAPNALHALKASERVPAPVASSDAREESRVVAAARDALRSGDSAGALSLLAQARQRFGAGVLGQEREALLIEALAKSGQGAAARVHGQAFLKNYANSPYAARVRQLVGAD
jgi:hypothetical protein